MNDVLEFGTRPAWFEVNLVRGSDASYGLKLQNPETGEDIAPGTTDAVLVLGTLPFLASKTSTQFSWTILAADVALITNNARAELVFIQGNRRRVHASGKVYVR